MLKESEIKKIIKTFNKYGKGLRPDGIYTFKDNKIYSAIKNQIHGTPGSFSVQFNNDLIKNAFYLMCKFELINGLSLNRVIGGTAVKVVLDECGIVTSIECKDSIWDSQLNYNVKNALLSSYNNFNSYIDDEYKIDYEIDFSDEFIQLLKDEKNFIIDLSDYIDLPDDMKVLKISNKLLKNFSKDTNRITLQISKPYDEIKVVKYIVYDDIAQTECIYGVLIK